MMRSDVFILNSYYEGLSHVLIEACMHYLPIIARNSGGNSEVVSNNVNGYILIILINYRFVLKKFMVETRKIIFKF